MTIPPVDMTEIGNYVRKCVAEKAAETKFSEYALMSIVIADLAGEERRKDGRAHLWRARFRLYHGNNINGDPIFDSDPDLNPVCPGETTLLGLQAVADMMVELVTNHHRSPPVGFDEVTLKRKFNSLRSNMCNRGDGVGAVKVPYEVSTRFGVRQMLARCDIHRYDLHPKPQANSHTVKELVLPIYLRSAV